MALRPRPARTQWGKALELGLEFGSSVVVGLALGYYLDRWLGTEPVLLLVFMLFGFAAGMRSLIRFAQRQNAPPEDDSGEEDPPERRDSEPPP